MLLVEQAYRLSAKLPKDELYGLSTQIKRASVSIPANIAEGYGRGVTGSYLQFLRIAPGHCESLKPTFFSQRASDWHPLMRLSHSCPDVTGWDVCFTA